MCVLEEVEEVVEEVEVEVVEVVGINYWLLTVSVSALSLSPAGRAGRTSQWRAVRESRPQTWDCSEMSGWLSDCSYVTLWHWALVLTQTETPWSDVVVARPDEQESSASPAVTPRPPGTSPSLSPCLTPGLRTRPGPWARTGETDTELPTETLCLTSLPALCLTPTLTLTTNTTTLILSTTQPPDNNTVTIIMSRQGLNLPPTPHPTPPPPLPQSRPVNRLTICQLINRWNIIN